MVWREVLRRLQQKKVLAETAIRPTGEVDVDVIELLDSLDRAIDKKTFKWAAASIYVDLLDPK